MEKQTKKKKGDSSKEHPAYTYTPILIQYIILFFLHITSQFPVGHDADDSQVRLPDPLLPSHDPLAEKVVKWSSFGPHEITAAKTKTLHRLEQPEGWMK